MEDSTVLAADLLEEAGVAVTPGVDFEDPATGAVLRRSYAGAVVALDGWFLLFCVLRPGRAHGIKVSFVRSSCAGFNIWAAPSQAQTLRKEPKSVSDICCVHLSTSDGNRCVVLRT